MTRRGSLLATASVLPDHREPGLLEHRARADEGHRQVDPARSRVDRVALDGGRAARRGVVDRAVDQGRRVAALAVAAADDDADDAPHRQVVERPDQRRPAEPSVLRARADAAPAHGLAVVVPDHPGRVRAVAERPERRLPVPVTQLGDLAGRQAVRQAPAVARPPVGVDDRGEVVDPVRCHGTDVESHGPSQSAIGRPVKFRGAGCDVVGSPHQLHEADGNSARSGPLHDLIAAHERTGGSHTVAPNSTACSLTSTIVTSTKR